MASNNVFCKRLKEEREKRGWTQEYMSKILEIKIGTLSGYERGYRKPDLVMLNRIAGLFETSVDYLMGRGEHEHVNWWEGENPPQYIDLENFIRSQPNLRLYGEPLDDVIKRDILLVLRTTWEVLNKEKARG